jgi:hypothetical protein
MLWHFGTDTRIIPVSSCTTEHVLTYPAHTLHSVVVLSRCKGGRNQELAYALITSPTVIGGPGACEMQCSDPKAADVSCGGTMNAHTVYVLKGKQGRCCT